MNWLKKLWDWLVGAAKRLLDAVLDKVLDRAKEVLDQKEVAALALEAIKAAALRESGIELGECAVDTTLQLIYDAWKSLGYPEE